jgi:hypothetical protein
MLEAISLDSKTMIMSLPGAEREPEVRRGIKPDSRIKVMNPLNFLLEEIRNEYN